MAQRISELQRLRNELAQLKSPTQDNLSQSDINIPQNSAQKNTGSGLGYTLGKLWGGIVRSHEGWFDAAIAQAADVFGNDELAERIMKNDWMDYGKYDASFNPGKGWEFTGDVASGVGNLLPAIALSFVPFAGAGLSQGWFTQSASGQAVSDAVKETGELGNKEWAYGTASGLIEGAIERVSGGIGGTSLAKGIGKKIGKNALGKLAVNMAGEGLEEVASDIVDPILKRTTGVDNEAQMPTMGELGRTFAVGGVTGAVMGGGTTALQAAKVGGFNNLNAINDSNELVERQADNNLRQTEGKKALYTEEDLNRTKESLSKRLKKMDDATRAEFLKRNARVAQMFNEDGTVKDFASSAEAYNTSAYSASLKGREGSFAYKPVADTSAISQEAKQVMNTLTKITGGNTNIVLTEDALTTESGKSANGLYQDGVIYLNAKATDYDKALKVGIHEVVHGLEGTKEYNELAKYISQQIKNNPDLAQRYNIDAYRNAYDKLLKGEWTESTKDYQAATEIFADYIGNVVAENKTLLNNLVARNSNVFVRFLNWVRNSIAKLGESAEERKMRKDLQKLEKMLVEALQAGNGGITLEEVEDLARTAEKARKTQDGNVQSVKFEENKKADGKIATARASIQTIDGEEIVVIDTDQDIFDGVETKDFPKVVKEYMRSKFQGKVLSVDSNKAFVQPHGIKEYVYPANRRMDESIKSSKMKAGTELDNLLKVAKYIGHENDDGRHSDAVRGWDKYKTKFIVDGRKFEGEVSIKLIRRGDVFHDISKIKDITPGTNGRDLNGQSASRQGDVIEGKPSTSIIPQKDDLSSENAKKVEKISTSRKSIDVNEATNLTEEQAEKRGLIDKKGGTVRYNLFTFEDGGKAILQKNLNKNGFTKAEADEVVKTMEDMAEYFRMLEADVEDLVDWNSAKVLYDPKTGKNVFTAMIKNGDYPLNIDLSTICKKRKALTKVLNTLVKRGYIDTVDLSAENIVKINDILKKYGYEVACPACFVETKRYRVDDWAHKFLDPWNELIKNAVPNAKYLDFVNGVYAVEGAQVDTDYLNRIINEHTKVSESGKRSKDSIAKMAELILKNESVRGYMNKADLIGSVGLEKMKQHQDKLYSLVHQRSGTATPKIIQEVQPYNGELGIYKQLAKKAEEVGGVRMFSFSDFTVLQTFDFLQVVADLTSQKATMQSYTKEIAFALLFGQTGIKINLSMIPAVDKSVGKENAGLNAKGEPIYSEQWGVDYNAAKDLMFKEGYNGNVGTATIGISKNHILALLDDTVTNYIIPYHKSNINPTLAKMMDIDWYTDYTAVQNTRYNNGEKITATEAKKFNFFTELAKAQDARKMAQNYLNWCKENNYIPKFEEFSWHPNYYKLLVDFQVYKTVDGKEVYAPQNPVQMKFPDNFKEILKNELKGQAELDASRDVNFEKAMGEVVDVLKKPTSRASIDVDADLADFPSIDKWFDSLTAEELRELIDNDYTVEDISEELNVDPKKMRYLIRREGLGGSYVEDSKKAVMKQARIDEAIEDSGASNPTYARDYITAISPKDFIDLTVTKNHVERDAFDAEVIGDHGSKMGEWDYEKALQTSRNPYLQIDKATGRVIGHNGRHRIRALEKAGIQSVEIQVEFFDEDGRLIKYDAETIPKMAISSQYDTDIETNISKVIPLNESHRAEIESTYGEKVTPKAGVRYALDAELDKKTTERVQTAVSNMTMAERWQKVLEDLKLGKADQWIKAQIAWTDEQAGIIQAGKNVGVVVHGEVQRARVAKASAINMLNDSQRDYSGTKRVGDSLKAIFKPIQSRGKKVAQEFNLYLLHQLNVDRMSAVERGLRDEVAPVFEEKVDKAFSLEKIQQLEKQYPEFKETAEKVWKYNQNLLQYRVDAGLITQEQADKMTEMYPHYVPAFYEHNGGGTSGAFVGQKGVAVKTGIKSAKGSTGVSDIKDVQASIAKQTVAVVRAASINKVVEKLYDGAVAKGDFTDIEEVGREKMTDPDVDYDKEIPKNNEVFFYKDGERITLAVTQYVDAGFRGLTAGAQLGDPLTTLSAKAISLFKKLVTSYNPLFAVTNTLRDAQEALFYTKYPKRFFANYGKALVTRKSDPRLKELWEQYKAMGGTGSGYFSQDTGVYDDRSKLRRSVEWLGDKMQIVNEWVEQAPRFAEFVASVEAGNSLEQALYDSAEVTTNFSRGGKMAKALNRHLIPFLNPSIQGWSKMWRGWVAPMDGKSAAEIERLSKQSKGRRFLSNYGALMFKAILCGVSVGLFNDMLYRWIDDDEDYANLPLNIKENYYLIKVGKKFIKIPKGRVVALYGSAWTRLSEAMNGNEDALNAWDWAKSASEMVSPLESAFRSIIAPVRDVQTNTTWYGGQIENASMENLAPSERYDEGTSKIAIAMGKTLNYSPKKIHYLLDQYSGVLGDFILPKTTNKAEKGMLSSRFVVDPLYNSDVSTKYYDYKEELTFAKNSGDTNAKLMLKYMNEVQDDLSKMYQQKRDIANDNSLTNKEKREQTEIIQGLINATLSSSVDMADEFEQALIDNQYEQAVAVLTSSKAYTKLDEKSQTYASNKMNEYYYEMCKAEVSGTKPSMKYALYTSMNAPDLVVYLSNINNIEADKDKKGNTISGSRKEKVHKYIQGLRLSAQQKNILMYLAGYKPTDAGQKTVEAYLTKQGYTAKEVDELWNN